MCGMWSLESAILPPVPLQPPRVPLYAPECSNELVRDSGDRSGHTAMPRPHPPPNGARANKMTTKGTQQFTRKNPQEVDKRESPPLPKRPYYTGIGMPHSSACSNMATSLRYERKWRHFCCFGTARHAPVAEAPQADLYRSARSDHQTQLAAGLYSWSEDTHRFISSKNAVNQSYVGICKPHMGVWGCVIHIPGTRIEIRN